MTMIQGKKKKEKPVTSVGEDVEELETLIKLET